MYDLDAAVRLWRKELLKNEAMEDGYVAELESHLRDAIDAQIEQGVSPEVAFEKAIIEIGHVNYLSFEFHKTHTRSLSGRPPWKPSRWMPALLWSYGKLALRKVRRQKGYSLINIAGLAIGMACCILIMTWVQDELSYDRFHDNAEQIFRVVSEVQAGGTIRPLEGSPSPAGPTLKDSYPEVLNFTRVQSGWKGWYLHYGEKNFSQERLAAVDPSFFEVFKFPFLRGDPQSALKDRYSIVITESLAAKCFGEKDPMGEILQIFTADMKVTGVIKDIPHNSHIQFDYAFPVFNMTEWRESKLDSWRYTQFATYIELKPGTDAKVLEKKILDLAKNYDDKSRITLALQPIKDIHLHSTQYEGWINQYSSPGNIIYVYIFSLTAFCVLLIACINFMNLATARYGSRAREVGMRKVIGARRQDLIKQFIGESCLLSILSLAIAVFFVDLMLPTFNQLSGKTLALDFFSGPQIWLTLLAVAFMTGIISGSYPALYLSSFPPTQVLKDIRQQGWSRGNVLRRILVVLQFAFTIVLILGTMVIYSQLRYINNKDLGYDQNNIIIFANYGQYGRNYETARAELLQNPDVLSVCKGFPPGHSLRGTTRVDWEGKDPSLEIVIFSDIGDYDFVNTFGVQMAEGRYYSREFSTDEDNFVINETMAKIMGFDSAVGKRLTYKGKTGEIIGVVKDYHGGSLHHPIQPKVIELRGGFFVCVKYRSGTTAKMLTFLEQKWKKFVKGRPFRHGFVDESIDNYYKTERRIGRIFQYFTILAIFIACLGLFGLASFTAEQRTKEIGIRKVLGASVMGVVTLLSKQFTKWVLIANVIAWPIAYIIIRRWLQGFAYRIELGWELFVAASVLALVIALLTVSYQAIRAATANPVDSLRYE